MKKSILILTLLIVSQFVSAQLDFMGKIFDAEDGVNGIRATEGICISNDRNHLYVGSRWGISHFFNDLELDSLIFVKTYYHETDGMYQLLDNECIRVSNDDRFLYVASESSSAINIFERNKTTGELNLIKTYSEKNGDPFKLQGIMSIELSNDNDFIYITTYLAHTIIVFSRDEQTGELAHVQTIRDNEPGGVVFANESCLSSNNKFFYASSSMYDHISVFERNDETGILTFVQKQPTQNFSTNGIKISPDNRFLYCFGNKNILLYQCDTISGIISFIKEYHSEDDINGMRNIYAMGFSQNTDYLLTMSSGDSSFSSFKRNIATGELQQVYSQQWLNLQQHTGGHNFSSMITFDDKVMVTSYWESAFFTTEINQNTGVPFNVEKISNRLGADIGGLRNVEKVETSPDGEFLYATTEGSGFSTFKRDPTTGSISYLDSYVQLGQAVEYHPKVESCLAVDSLIILSLGNGSNGAISIFKMDSEFTLNPVAYLTKDDLGIENYIRMVGDFAIDADNKHIYMGTPDDILVFDYNSEGLILNLKQQIDVFELHGINFGLDDIVLTKNGKYLFIHNDNNRIFIFKRDLLTGKLSFIDEYIM